MNGHIKDIQTIIREIQIKTTGTSLVVQWLRLYSSNAGGPGSIPGQGQIISILGLLGGKQLSSIAQCGELHSRLQWSSQLETLGDLLRFIC